MRIARFSIKNKEFYGILHGETVLCLPALAKRFKQKLPETLEEFITSGEHCLKTAENLLEKYKRKDSESVSVPLSEVSFLSPVPFPPKIICLGWNYLDHTRETDKPVPKAPVIFMKPHTAIIGPNEKIVKPAFVKELDYEGELAIVMGKTAKNVPVSAATDYVFGYTIFDDVSAREIQFGDGQWTRGKSFDTFAPTGPCVTTANQLRNTDDLSIRTWVNGELRQNGTTRNMVFNVSQIVHQLSRVMTLEPCDIIATGTPAGVAMAMQEPKWLKSGDVVKIEIDGIGVLENLVAED